MPKASEWKAVEVAQNGTTSAECDLGRDYEKCQVYIPALDSATMQLQVARNSGDTPSPVYEFNYATAADFAKTTTARSTQISMVVWNIFGRFVTIVCGASQSTAKRTFYVRGINPL